MPRTIRTEVPADLTIKLMAEAAQTHLAVYGTLRRWPHYTRNHPLLEGASYGGTCRVYGKLYMVNGVLPALRVVPVGRASQSYGSGGVKAELYRVSAQRLYVLDQYEGFCYDHPERSWYKRVLATVVGGNGQTVWVYEYVNKLRTQDLVSHRDYRAMDAGNTVGRVNFHPPSERTR